MGREYRARLGRADADGQRCEMMSRIDYDGDIATVYDRGRAIPLDGLTAWRTALARYLPPASGLPVLDLGAGTGLFAVALAEWFGVEVIAVEPAAMRRQALRRR